MKKLLSLLFFYYLSFLFLTDAQAQIKLHNDGQVSLGDLTTEFGVQVQPNGYCGFKTRINTAYSWATLSIANNSNQKHWIVQNRYCSGDCWGKHMFYVHGNGNVYTTGVYSISASCCESSSSKEGVNGELALSVIKGLRGYYYDDGSMLTAEEIQDCEYIDKDAVEGMIADIGKKNISLSAEEMVDVFPEAIRTDSQNRLCINYQSVITMLVEAVKQQQVEIDELRMTLKNNGMLKP